MNVSIFNAIIGHIAISIIVFTTILMALSVISLLSYTVFVLYYESSKRTLPYQHQETSIEIPAVEYPIIVVAPPRRSSHNVKTTHTFVDARRYSASSSDSIAFPYVII